MVQKQKSTCVKALGDGKFMLPKGRVNFPQIVTRISDDAEYDAGQFSCHIIWDDSVDLSLLEKEIQQAAKKEGLKKGYRNPLRDGEEKEDMDGYGEGTVFCKLKSYKSPPSVVWADKTRVENDSDIISGSFIRAIVSMFAYDKKGGRGVVIVLHSAQCLGGGTRLIMSDNGQNESAVDHFDEEEIEDTDEADDEI